MRVCVLMWMIWSLVQRDYIELCCELDASLLGEFTWKPFIAQLLPFDSTKKKKKKKVVIQDHGDDGVDNLADKAQNLPSMSKTNENLNSLLGNQCIFSFFFIS